MSRQKLIAAFNMLAEAAAIVAIELEASDAAGAGSAPSTTAPAPTQAAGVPSAPAAVDHDSCPKHGVPFENGQYGPYCRQKTDDPAWGKSKTDRDGNPVMWCRITPKNAQDWLNVQAAR
jgi:hypothetical protein